MTDSLANAIHRHGGINAIFPGFICKTRSVKFPRSLSRGDDWRHGASLDYTAENSSGASAVPFRSRSQKKHHPDHPAPPPLCTRSARFIAVFISVEFSSPINGDISTTTTTSRTRTRTRTMRPTAVRFEIGGRGGRSKESRGARSREVRRKEGRDARERNDRNRRAVREVRCHLATHASSFMPLDSLIERDMAKRTWFVRSRRRQRQ